LIVTVACYEPVMSWPPFTGVFGPAEAGPDARNAIAIRKEIRVFMLPLAVLFSRGLRGRQWTAATAARTGSP